MSEELLEIWELECDLTWPLNREIRAIELMFFTVDNGLRWHSDRPA